jgi:eukaryotic-like serine/threonine-protein kinase
VIVSSGSRVGPYEIVSRLGAGGMGEVWRARDTRLGREVAIKVLPSELASEGDRLKRFEREARAASSLSHPNIVTVYEIERLDGTSVIVMELVEGKTLRDLMADGPMPMRKILQIAPQIADGLARAHASGIVHRDLKPENVMVTKDGLVKILDFGLAKLTRPEEDSGLSVPSSTVSAATRPGIAMGTVAYMSPEQASGHPVDYRSDQFSLGSMLYEMAAGKPPFKKGTTAQTLAAIIEDEPEALAAATPKTPAPLRWVIERCLSKEPKGRYASTEDLARELTDLRDHVSELSSGAVISLEEPRRKTRWALVAGIVAGAAALAGMLFLGRRIERATVAAPRFRQLTFRGAGIGSARFAPDGQTIVFSSETEGRPPGLFSMRLDGPELRSLGLPPAHVLSISRSGEMAILLLRPFALLPRIGHVALFQLSYRDPFLLGGTLAEVPLAGGAPREILEDALFADWAPNGDGLAVVHRVGNKDRLEFPIGSAIYDREERLLNELRFSRQANRLAFKDWGELFLKDAGNPVRDLAGGDFFEAVWSDATGEIWYSLPKTEATEIRAVTPGGRQRSVTTLPADFALYDISADGRVLLGRTVLSSEILGSFPGEERERNLSYFNASEAADLSANGDVLLFEDISRNLAHTAYLRQTNGSTAKRLSDEAGGGALSPDGKLVLSETGNVPNAYHVLLPTGPGELRKVNTQGVDFVDPELRRAGFFPDSRRVFFSGFQQGHERRIWIQDLSGDKPRAITPEGTSRPVLLGEGQFLCARGADFEWRLFPTDGRGGEARKLAGLLPGEEPFRSTPDGKWLYIRGADELRPGETLMTTRVHRLDPWTGKRELWKEIPSTPSPSGGGISAILFSADGKTCVWTHIRYSTELVLAEGLK